MNFRPKIVAFLCNWCAYTGADLAGTSRMRYAPNIRIIRVMCSGRIEPTFILSAFQQGADGVLVCGCHPGDCHYQTGNYKCLRRFKLIEKYIAQIDDMGGALSAIEKGFMQNEIQNAAYDAQQAIERKEQIVVGVNQFQVKEEMTLERLKVDPAIEAGQRARLNKLRGNRDQRVVDALLDKLKVAATGTENLMPLFIECVENDITLGEICNTLRVIWGEYVAEGF